MFDWLGPELAVAELPILCAIGLLLFENLKRRVQFSLRAMFWLTFAVAATCLLGQIASRETRAYEEARRRRECPNGLRQIGLSLRAYYDLRSRESATKEHAS